MFKTLLRFWGGKDFLTQVLGEFKDMLDDTQKMYEDVSKKLIKNEDVEGLGDRIYDIDARVNGLEKHIRKRIVEHLTLQPSVDISACLVLMSVVKDAERLGDYCKNLFEVTGLLDAPLARRTYESIFNGLDGQILELFKQTRDAFLESSETKATEAWGRETRIVKKCDSIVERLAKSNLGVNEAVCYALIARYFKRLAAHLTNIATSVILPISDLDYFDERRKNEQAI